MSGSQPKPREGWLYKGVPKLIKQPKKLYFRHVEAQLCFYDVRLSWFLAPAVTGRSQDEKSKELRGALPMLDVINVFPDTKSKGVFMVVTQTESWRLQVGKLLIRLCLTLMGAGFR